MMRRNSPGPMMALVEQVGSRSSGMRARTAVWLMVTASSMPQPVMSTEPGPELYTSTRSVPTSLPTGLGRISLMNTAAAAGAANAARTRQATAAMGASTREPMEIPNGWPIGEGLLRAQGWDNQVCAREGYQRRGLRASAHPGFRPILTHRAGSSRPLQRPLGAISTLRPAPWLAAGV